MSTATSAAGDAFRESVRSWVEANFPPELKDQPASMEGAGDGDLAQALERWPDALAGPGRGAPTRPNASGGPGLTPAEARVISQEIGRAGGYNPIPLMAGMGVTHVCIDADEEVEDYELERTTVIEPFIKGSCFPDGVEVKSNCIGGRDNSTRDDVVSIH